MMRYCSRFVFCASVFVFPCNVLIVSIISPGWQTRQRSTCSWIPSRCSASTSGRFKNLNKNWRYTICSPIGESLAMCCAVLHCCGCGSTLGGHGFTQLGCVLDQGHDQLRGIHTRAATGITSDGATVHLRQHRRN